RLLRVVPRHHFLDAVENIVAAAIEVLELEAERPLADRRRAQRQFAVALPRQIVRELRTSVQGPGGPHRSPQPIDCSPQTIHDCPASPSPRERRQGPEAPGDPARGNAARELVRRLSELVDAVAEAAARITEEIAHHSVAPLP